MTNVRITGARVVTARGIVETDVVIAGKTIRMNGGARSRASRSKKSPPRTLDARGMILLPGFIDIHTHGYGGFDFTLGIYDARTDTFDASPERSREALGDYVRRMPSMGVTTSFLATMAAEAHTIRERLDLLGAFLKSRPEGTRLPGVFLEGTFISDQMLGAMNPDFVHRPDTKLFDELNPSGLIRLVLVAPEYGRPAQTLIRHLARRGIIAGAGHTGATAEELTAARRAGLRYMVHFLNGPTGSSFKPFNGGGAVEGGLVDEKLYVELIADGYHVDPRYARDVMARKGFDRMIAISDSMFAAGAVDGPKGFRSFQVSGVYGKVSPDGKFLQVAHDLKALFGSCLDLPTAMANLMNWLTREMPGVWTRRHKPLPTDDALVAVARMMATNPARLTGLDTELGIGRIAAGRTADLVLARLTGEPGAYKVKIHRTWIAGREVYAKK
jgi:N-acetylglucosamine-6-phosphate deacetylase